MQWLATPGGRWKLSRAQAIRHLSGYDHFTFLESEITRVHVGCDALHFSV